jgi:hypothetical protein
MIRWHLTKAEKQKIKEMTRAGVRQSVIARALGITAPSVSKAQRALGLPTRLAVPEKEIMQLFHQGWGGTRIAKHLRIAVSAVYKVAHKNDFRRPDGVGYPTNPENEAKLIEALKRKEDYSKRLAEKYKVGLCKTNRLAHEVLACPQFRPGVSKPPLSSNFPQKHFDVSAESDVYVELIRKIVDLCYGGKLLSAEHDQVFINACAKSFRDFESAPQPVVDCLKANLATALHTMRALDASHFVN